MSREEGGKVKRKKETYPSDGTILKCWIFKCLLILKVFIEFVTILLLFYVLVLWLQGMWDLRSPPGIKPAPPALEGEIVTTGLPGKSLMDFLFLTCRYIAFTLKQQQKDLKIF